MTDGGEKKFRAARRLRFPTSGVSFVDGVQTSLSRQLAFSSDWQMDIVG
jgi:hypothetical protein